MDDMASENERLQEVYPLWCATVDQLGEQEPFRDASMPPKNSLLADLLRRLAQSATAASYLKDPEFIQRIRQQRDISPPPLTLGWGSVPALRFGEHLLIRPFPSAIQPNATASGLATEPSLTDEGRLAALVAYTVIIRACCRDVRLPENYKFPIFDPAQTETYHQGRFLGSGNNGCVYTVFNHPDKRVLAVKVCIIPDIPKSPALKKAERRMTNLSHPNLVQFIASYQQGYYCKIYMEYVSGGTVAGMAAALGPMPEEETRAVIEQVLEGLVFLHAMNIVHRGIKGANLLIALDGCVKIADLGVVGKSMPKHGDSLELAVPWMSPEVVKETAFGRKTDVWNVGCVILEMHLGKNPWTRLHTIEAMIQISEAKWPPIDRVLSKDLQTTLEKVFVVETKRISSLEMQMEKWVRGAER